MPTHTRSARGWGPQTCHVIYPYPCNTYENLHHRTPHSPQTIVRLSISRSEKAKMPPFTEYWTKKQLQAACRERGISYHGLNKCGLIDELNSRVDHSWTKRELKDECGRRGLHNFNRLTKDGLIQRLNNYNGTVLRDHASQARIFQTFPAAIHTQRSFSFYSCMSMPSPTKLIREPNIVPWF